MNQEGEIQKFIVSEVEFCTPPIPPIYEIAGFDLEQDEQFFRRTLFPTWWKEERNNELVKQKELLKNKSKNKYISPRCEIFRVQEWNRRLYGYWFMNNGVPTYITGKNYFYLNWCQFDHEGNDGYPFYYDTDRLEFYFTEVCFNDKSCLGYLKIAGRGKGKTTKEVAIALEEMTRPPIRRLMAIQSKTETDAKTVIFSRKIIPTYKKLPDFFRPVSDSSTNSKNELSFFKPAIRGKEALDYIYELEEELESIIRCYPSNEGAIDGESCAIIIQDEIGKTEKVDVNARLDVNRFSVFRNNRKTGMILATTTVEEMEKGGANCFKVWKRSNQAEKNKNGFTNSGLYRYFSPNSETTRYLTINGKEVCTVDKFGFVNTELTKEYDKNERDSKTGSDLASYIRKNPETPDECFYIDNNACEFDALILNQRLSYLNTYGEETRRGGLRFNDKGEVEFFDSEKGLFNFHHFPDANIRNRVQKDYSGQMIPMNDHLYCIGGDPIEHGVNIDGRKSNAAAYAFEKFNKNIDKFEDTDEQRRPLFIEELNGKRTDLWQSYNFFIEYVGRPNNPIDYFDDMLMLCHYLGCKIHLETQKAMSLVNHFRSKGYGGFIMNRPKSTYAKSTSEIVQQNTPGSPASTYMIGLYTSELASFVVQHGHRIHFKSLVKDLLNFSVLKTTDFDSAVASGYTLLANTVVAVDKTDDLKEVKYFKQYKRINGQIVRIK